MRRWFYYILAILMAWLAFFGLISTLPVLSGFFTWTQAFGMTLTQWLPWMLLSPLIVWFTLRFPVEWTGRRWRFSIHVLVGILSVLLCAWLNEYLRNSTYLSFDRDFEQDHFGGGPPPFDQPPTEADSQQPPSAMDRGGPPFDGRLPMGGHHGPPLLQRAGFNVPIYLAIVGLSHAFIYFRRTQQRDRRALELETQLSQARLQALRMQLQPHFLFNTLNAISTLVQTNPQSAQEMIGSLGQMLRLSLDNGGDPEVPLAQELKFLDCYLEIAQTRFGDRLRVTHDIASGTGPALVPTFVLQPLVENAVRHGIEPGLAPGTIEITVRHSGGMLSISIRDSGVGLAEGNATASASQNGIGIANTRARLQNLYPGQHHFAVRNAAAGGCVAELEIPFHTAPLLAAGEPQKS